MGIEFTFFEAGHGDSILVSTDKTNILIDGGVSDTYQDEIASKINDLEQLDLVVLTHIDNDHICGLIELLKDDYNRKKIKKLWFNSPSEDLVITSNENTVNYGQGNYFFRQLASGVNHINDIYVEKQSEYPIGDDIRLTLLSPMKKDLNILREKWTEKKNTKLRDCNGKIVDVAKNEPPIDKREICDLKTSCITQCSNFFGKKNSKSNTSSIAFILEYKTKKFLLLGDADIRVVVKSLKKLGYSKEKNQQLEVEFIKLSHHGSSKNINKEFLDIVKTDTYIVLTNGLYPPKNRYRHPDKETLALILTHEKKRIKTIKFLFNNYLPIQNKFPDELNEKEQYNFLPYKSNTWKMNNDF